MPIVDASKLPARATGSSTLDVMQTGEQPSPFDGSGAFRTVCKPSHMAFDDPIVKPGQPGASHLHAFFGNTGANANTTSATLANSGNSTCRGGIANRSGYWVPAVIDTRTNAPMQPTESHFYYKTGYNPGIRPADVQVPPQGLRMIAGDAMAGSDIGQHHYFQCESADWTSRQKTIPNCAIGDNVVMAITFPQCWDGVNLDSPDHKSHMAYPRDGAGCPSTHPRALPEISYHIRIPVTVTETGRYWRLASDNYPSSQGAGGYSAHADWWNGWQPVIIDRFVRNCDQAARDCHSHLLGEGWAID
jgi:hypothetical protein